MSGRDYWSHETRLAAETLSVSVARQFVRLHLTGHDMQSLVDDVELVVSELATNAVAHAGTPFTVSLTWLDHTLVVEVKDDSPSGPRRVHPDGLAAAGRGVVIVEVLSTTWGVKTYASGGKSVWAELRAG